MPRWTPFEPYFWSLVNKTSTCWLWTGSSCKGYGRVVFHGARPAAHRVAWTLTGRDIPEGLFLLHKCDVRNCVRPEHLFVGTQKDNMQDWTQKGKNRLVNEGSPWMRGDSHWTRQPEAASWRQAQSKHMKEELRTGKRIVLRDPANGRIRGTQCAT